MSSTFRVLIVPLFFIPLLACGSDDDDSSADAGFTGGGGQGETGGEQAGGGMGAAGGQVVVPDTGVPEPTCSGISGTYDVTRTRSETRPGSCPPDSPFSPSLPISIVADSTEASGYYVKVGYTNLETGEVTFYKCVNNISNCSVFATCARESVSRDEVELRISGNSVTGTLARSDLNNNCTINFDLEGGRQ